MVEPTVRMQYVPNQSHGAPNAEQFLSQFDNAQSLSELGDVSRGTQSWHDLHESIQQITSNGMLRHKQHRGRRTGPSMAGADGQAQQQHRQPRQVDDSKIREALELPPSQSAMASSADQLRYSTISRSSFYRNH